MEKEGSRKEQKGAREVSKKGAGQRAGRGWEASLLQNQTQSCVQKATVLVRIFISETNTRDKLQLKEGFILEHGFKEFCLWSLVSTADEPV